jgi:hypothetical protein
MRCADVATKLLLKATRPDRLILANDRIVIGR